MKRASSATPAPMQARGARRARGRWWIWLPPLLFLVVFFLVPFLFALKISLAGSTLSVPPYSPMLQVTDDHHFSLRVTWDNFLYLFTDRVYLYSYLYSLRTALFSTLICLSIGYPMAYAMARATPARQRTLMMLIVLPFWTSFLLRVYALEGVIRDHGLLAWLLEHLGLMHGPLHLLHSSFAVYLGIVYSYLPFMVLPLYATLEKMDRSLLEAAADLGSPPWRAFLDVTLPMSLPGVIAGSMLVFIPAVGEFVIPSLLGGPDNLMIGRVLWDEFFSNRDWPVASAVAIVFLVFMVGPIALYQHYSLRGQQA